MIYQAAGSNYMSFISEAEVGLTSGGLLGVGMFAPGIVGVTVGLLILLTVRDSPEKIGYPPIEVVAKKETVSQVRPTFIVQFGRLKFIQWKKLLWVLLYLGTARQLCSSTFRTNIASSGIVWHSCAIVRWDRKS